jgi:hypothetical protein
MNIKTIILSFICIAIGYFLASSRHVWLKRPAHDQQVELVDVKLGPLKPLDSWLASAQVELGIIKHPEVPYSLAILYISLKEGTSIKEAKLELTGYEKQGTIKPVILEEAHESYAIIVLDMMMGNDKWSINSGNLRLSSSGMSQE